MSDVLVKPAFQSAAQDSGDPTKFGPNAWNAARLFSGGVDGQIVTKSAASATGAAWVDSIPTTRTVNGHALSADVIVTKGDLGLGNVENTALSTWGGSANLTTVGTLATLTVTAPIVGSVTGASGSSPASALTGTTLAAGVTGAPQTWTGLHTFNGGVTINGSVTLTGVLMTGVLTTTVDAIGTTPTDGAVYRNTTPATLAVPVQISPRTRWSATGWDTDDAVSRTMHWAADVTGTSGAVLTSLWRLLYTLDAGGAATPLTLTNAGALTITGGLTCTNVVASGVVQAGAGNFIGWAGLTRLVASVDAKLSCWNNALTVGVGLDWSTNAVLKIRTTAQSADASLTALNITASGAMVNRTKAGTPVDGDVTSPVDGMVVVDTTASKIWTRIGGVWKGVAVA